MSRVVHFEFVTPDPGRETEFFRTVFGWDIKRWGDEEYWLAETGKGDVGIDGAVMPSQGPDQQRVVNTIGVEDLDESIRKAMDAGATMAMDKQEIPEIGWTAYLLSPTGILFGMMQPMPMP